MMSLEHLRPYWNRILQAKDQTEVEILFQHMLKIQHPELITSNRQNSITNCQILLHYLSTFEHTLKTRPRISNRNIIEICTNFMRIWILDIVVIALELN